MQGLVNDIWFRFELKILTDGKLKGDHASF